MSVIDDYIRKFDPEIRSELERIRAVAYKLLPEHLDAITYNMPTVQYKGKSMIGFNVYKNHIGIYPFSGRVIYKIDRLKKYNTTKGGVQSKFDDPIPDDLIEKIIEERLKQAGY